jgi:NADH dehydrogenase
MILVVGATGLVGGSIARGLLADGRKVRVLVRPCSDARPLIDAGAQPVAGDLKDPSSLVGACAGVATLITTASAGSRGGADTPQTVDLEGNRHLIDAAREAGVGQFVFVSTIAADEDSPVPVLRAKAAAEAHLRHSGLPHTILAATPLMDVLLPLIVGGPARAGRPVTLVGEGRRRHSFVAAADVAAFAVAAVGHPAALNRRVVVGGPEAVSLRDVVAVYERVLGRAIPVRTVAPGALLPDLPPVPGLAEAISGQVAALETFDSPIEMAGTARTFGVRPTPLESFVRREASRVPEGPEGTSRLAAPPERVARRFVEAFAAGDTAVLEEIVREDLVDHNALPGQQPGRRGLLDAVAAYRTAFPDLAITVEQVVAQGDAVVQYGAISGTNTGPVMGQPATGRRATFPYMDLYRIADGRIVETWHLEDIAGMLQQLGLR